MRLWYRVLCASVLGLFLTMLIVYWELRSADLRWEWNVDPESTTLEENLESPEQRREGANILQIQKGENQSTEETRGYFRRLFQDTYIYSAFYEHQNNEEESTIRLIILSGKYYQPKLTCHYCSSSETACACPSQTAEFYTNNENHGRIYGGYIATCDVPRCFKKDSPYVYVTAEGKDEMGEKVPVPLISTHHKSTPFDYAVCIPPLRGQGSDFLYQLVEFIELTRILGAAHFTFYDFNTDDQLKRALRYYQEQGVVTLLPWNLPDDVTSNGQNIWYNGQVLAVQDCLYRNKGKAKYLAFNDIDEFIVPLEHSTVPLLLNNVHSETFCGHCFDSVIFSLNARIPKKNKHVKLLSQRLFHRTSEKLSSWSKCIVDPLRVFEMGIHHVSKASRKQLAMNKVGEELGLVFHYRTCSSAYGIGKACGNLIPDYTLQRLSKTLQNNVDVVLKHLNFKLI